MSNKSDSNNIYEFVKLFVVDGEQLLIYLDSREGEDDGLIRSIFIKFFYKNAINTFTFKYSSHEAAFKLFYDIGEEDAKQLLKECKKQVDRGEFCDPSLS